MVAAGSGSERFVVEGKTGLVARGVDAGGVGRRAARSCSRDPERLAAMGREARAWSLAHAPSWRQVLTEDLLPAWRAAVDHHHRRVEAAS